VCGWQDISVFGRSVSDRWRSLSRLWCSVTFAGNHLHRPDTALVVTQSNPYLSIYLDNYQDTVAGFQFVLVSRRPDLVRFDFSGGGFDTSGTLLSGFEWFRLRILRERLPLLAPLYRQCQSLRCHNYWGFLRNRESRFENPADSHAG